MRAAERGEDQLSGVGLAGWNGHAGATFVNFNERVQIGKIQLRIDAVHVKVQGDGNHVEISGAFTVPKKRSFDAVRSGEQAKLRRRHAGETIVVGMQANGERIAVPEVTAHPFDLICVNIRHRHLHGVGQVQDHFSLRSRLPDIHHRFGNIFGKLDFGRAETFRRILEHDVCSLEPGQSFLDPLRSLHGDLDDFLL